MSSESGPGREALHASEQVGSLALKEAIAKTYSETLTFPESVRHNGLNLPITSEALLMYATAQSRADFMRNYVKEFRDAN